MDVQRLVDAYLIGLGDNSDNSSLLQTLSQLIVAGDTSLLELVQALGSHLASEEASRRSRGIQVLSDVLNDLPPQAIPAQAATKLTEFFCARLADATCVPRILSSIGALMRLPAFTDRLTVGFLNDLFKEVHVQSFQHSTRNAAYGLLDLAIQTHPEAIKSMGDNFVLGFAQMLDGEKDPRSLMAAFQIIPKIVDLVDVKNNAEDLFDVIFCYFPITFKHRDGDPSSAITPESLKLALRTALTCSPYFGSLAIKQLVSKASATSPSAKIDAFETLAAGTRVYSSDDFRSELEPLVEQIREDVVMAANDEVVDAALDALEAVYAAVSPAAPSESGGNVASENSPPLDYVLKEAVFQLTADEIKSADQTGRILRAVARSSVYNCSVVSDAVLPIVAERLDSADTPSLTVRRELMDVLNYVLSANCDAARRAECLESEKTSLLSIYRPETSVPVDNEHGFLHIVRLKGITLLVLLPGFLDENETAVALQTLARAAIEHNADENVNKEGAHLLVQLAQSSPDDIKTTVLPMFFDALCDETAPNSADDSGRVSRLLNALGAIGVAAPNVLLALLQGLVTLVISGRLAQTHLLPAVTTVRKIVEAATSPSDSAALSQEILLLAAAPLADWAVESTGAPSGNQQRPSSQLITEIAKAIVAVFSKLDPEVQTEKLKPLFERLFPAIADSSADQLIPALPLFSAAVCSCWPQTVLPVPDVVAFVDGLTTVALTTADEMRRTACLEIVATVVNKTKASAIRAQLADLILKRGNDGSSSEASDSSLVLLYQWAARGLVACNDNAGYECVRRLVALITSQNSSSLSSSPQAARLAADGFGIVLGSHAWAVSPAAHGVFKLLAKQRLYATVLPEITAGFSNTANSGDDGSVKTNLLVMLTNVVQHMPKSVLMNGGIETIVPLLLSAARLTDGALKAASIRTITMIILETPDTLRAELVNSIVPLLLAATTTASADGGDDNEYLSSNTIEVRRAALDALALIPEKYSYSLLHAVTKSVVRALARSRDDRKRLVRGDAVKAYNKWINFGG
ncbi:hypothetical protein H4S06_002533 [Coemansia sp. BCRC 34490]|nr:hypothetical protein H4S06_002533 [Coemansia sp. BCRC 34490]